MRSKVDIFENCYCLSINQDRYDYLCKSFTYYGLQVPKLFSGLTKEPNGETACLIGHMSLVMMARCLKLPFITVFEEDAYPRRDIVEKLDYYMSNLPDDCGIICYGRNGISGVTDEFGDYFIAQERPYGSHAYTIFSEAYDDFIISLEKQRIADIALKGRNFDAYKPYWTKELLFIQKNIDSTQMSFREGFSRKFIYHDPGFSEYQGGGNMHFSATPPKEFDIIIPGIPEYDAIYVTHPGWRGTCYVDSEMTKIKHIKDVGVLEKLSDNSWKINWEKWNPEKLIVKDGKYAIVKF